jgi:hypothetical protein
VQALIASFADSSLALFIHRDQSGEASWAATEKQVAIATSAGSTSRGARHKTVFISKAAANSVHSLETGLRTTMPRGMAHHETDNP